MGWHVVGTHQYYYRSKRVNGKVVRQYIGKGAVGELAAATADLRRLERTIEAIELNAEVDRLQQADVPLGELCESTDMLARAVLILAGYHRHDRGEWRKRHGHDVTSAGRNHKDNHRYDRGA
jgi:hypothetical protein